MRKFRPGRRIRTFAQLMQWIDAPPRGWVYLRQGTTKPTSPKVLENMTVMTIAKYLQGGMREAFPVIVVDTEEGGK
ncbi:MAG: hypothetical protein ACKVW3_01810 [Phycisphaerales bacterium]